MSINLTKKQQALTGLLVVTIIWGLTFIWMDWAVSTAQRTQPELSLQTVSSVFVFLRFALAAMVMFAFIPKSRLALKDSSIISGGIWLGVIIWAGFFLQMLGISHPDITPAVSAFLTSLYVVFTAIIGVIIGRQRLTLIMLIGVVLATFGAGWISGPPEATFGLPEWLTVIGAFMFAAHILATDRLTRERNPLQLTAVMLLTVALIGAVILPFTVSSDDVGMISTLITEPDFFIPLFCCSILGSFTALLILTTYQKYIPPVRAAILYAMEPVWAAIFSISLGMEGELSMWLFIGGGTLLIGNIVVEWDSIKTHSSTPYTEGDE